MDIISRAEAKEQGLKHYFTGKPCKRGHIEKRFVTGFSCVVCAKMHYDERRKKHPEKYAETSNKHYWNNREKCVKAVMDSQKRNKSRHLKNKRDYHHRNKERLSKERREWYQENKQIAYQRHKAYREKNRAKVREAHRRWCQRNKEKVDQYRKGWLERNPGIVSEIHKDRMKNDPEYKAARSIRHTLNRTLRLLKKEKGGSTESVLGYTIQEFKDHIERNMLPDMSWENQGEVWHLDHVVSVAEMVKMGITDPKKVNALKNLMPEYKGVNLSKGAGFALSSPPML